jgi:hypothetical protein
MPSTINAQAGNATTYTSLIKTGAADANLAFETNGIDAITINQLQNANFVSTGAIILPRGTTAQRPASPINGMWRYNTTLNQIETYINTSWVKIA